MAKILVVEKVESPRELYKLELESEGHAVVTARGPDEAFRTIEDGSPDLVVWEAGPPGQGGFEAMGRMIARLPETPVVLNTTCLAYRNSFQKRVPAACILKSSDTGELRTKIRDLLESATCEAKGGTETPKGEAPTTGSKERTAE